MRVRKLADEREDEIQVVGGEVPTFQPSGTRGQRDFAVEFGLAGAGVGKRLQAVREEVFDAHRRSGRAVGRRAEHLADAGRQPHRVDLQTGDQRADFSGRQLGDAAGRHEFNTRGRCAERLDQLFLRQAKRPHDAADRRSDGMEVLGQVAHDGSVFQVNCSCLMCQLWERFLSQSTCF